MPSSPLPNTTGQVRDIVAKLISGEIKWQSLPREMQQAIIRFMGLPEDASPEQIRAGAQSFLQGGAEGEGGLPPLDMSDITGATGAAGFRDQVMLNYRFALNDMYMNLWGEPAPPGWVKEALDSGMNLFELDQQEREKPAFMGTRTARDEAASYAHEISSALGMR